MRPAGQARTHANGQADGRRNDDYYPVETPPDSVTSATARARRWYFAYGVTRFHTASRIYGSKAMCSNNFTMLL